MNGIVQLVSDKTDIMLEETEQYYFTATTLTYLLCLDYHVSVLSEMN